MNGEFDRRLANIVRIGAIAEIDTEKALVKVNFGDNQSDWLHWMTQRAGFDRHWSVPDIGEQVLVIAPSGNLTTGFVLGGIFQDAHPAPANNSDVTRYEWRDGAYVEYNREAHHYQIDVPASGHIVLRIGETVLTLRADSCTVDATNFNVNAANSKFSGNMDVGGNINVPNGNVVASGIGLVTHHHEKTATHPTSVSGKAV